MGNKHQKLETVGHLMGITQLELQQIHLCSTYLKMELLNIITKGDLNLKWPKLGNFNLPKLVYLCTQLEKDGYKIKLPMGSLC